MKPISRENEVNIIALLIIVEWLKITIKVVKVLILNRKVGLCDNTLQNTLRDV